MSMKKNDVGIAAVPKIDTLWFRHTLETAQLSQRQLARELKIDPAAVSLMLRGQRSMRLTEAAKIAELVHQPFTEIVRRAGIEIDKPLEKADVCPVAGRVNAKGEIAESKPRAADFFPSPPGSPPNCKVLKVRTSMSPAEYMDGWMLFFEDIETLTPEAIGRLCVVTLGSGEKLVRHVRRGFEPGTYSLRGLTLEETDESARLRSASPVLWIRT